MSLTEEDREEAEAAATAAGRRSVSTMSGEDVAKAFVTHFYSKFANNGAMVREGTSDRLYRPRSSGPPLLFRFLLLRIDTYQ